MPPLRDITSTMLRENNLRENVQASFHDGRNDLGNRSNIENHSSSINNNTTVTLNSTPVSSSRRSFRSRSLSGNSISLSSRRKKIAQQQSLPLASSKMMNTAINSMQDKLNFLSISGNSCPNPLENDAFSCCCTILKKSKRRYSTPARSLSSRKLDFKMTDFSSNKANNNYLVSSLQL